jgi:hypothetical protein
MVAVRACANRRALTRLSRRIELRASVHTLAFELAGFHLVGRVRRR